MKRHFREAYKSVKASKKTLLHFQVSSTESPFTKRGVLATINGVYDPIGFVAQVIIRGKFILQDMMSSSTDWDEPFLQAFKSHWSNWVESLAELQSITIPRCYFNLPSSDVRRLELHIFSYASHRAISVVAYLKLHRIDGDYHVSFIHKKQRLPLLKATSFRDWNCVR